MRILELITLGEIGGAQTVLVDLVKGFTSGKYDVEVDVAFGEGDYLKSEFQSWFPGQVFQIPYLDRKINLIKDFRALLYIKKLCEQRRYDIVHCHSSKASWLGRVAGKLAGIPRICVTVHGISFRPEMSARQRFIYKNIERLIMPMKAEYIFVSQHDLNEMQSLGLDKSLTQVIPNGRPIPPKPNRSIKGLLDIDNEAPVVCMVGRLSDQKNPLSFIRIARTVIDTFPNELKSPHFVLIGDGPLYEECKREIYKNRITGNVHLLGSAQHAGQHFWEADVALLSSNYEACPLVVIEAMATGTPVVATNVGGTGYLMKHGGTGYLFNLNNDREAAAYIRDLLINKKMCEEMGREAYDFYMQNFTVNKMVKQYVNYFNLKEKPQGVS